VAWYWYGRILVLHINDELRNLKRNLAAIVSEEISSDDFNLGEARSSI
jgi:hypothetical protein